jgi:hypothetical protein
MCRTLHIADVPAPHRRHSDRIPMTRWLTNPVAFFPFSRVLSHGGGLI